MLKLGELNVLIKGDNKGLDHSMDEAERTVKDGAGRMSGALGSIAKAAVGAWAAVGAVEQIRSAVKAASDLQQSVGGIDAVFGKSAASMHAWAAAADKNLGLSEDAANSYAAVLGAQLKNAGGSLDTVGTKTKALVQLGADLSATYGGTVADAVEAISAALKGEMDPIEKYGISLNQALLQQQALAMGLSKDSTKWTLAQKQQIVMAALYKQSGDASGQFAAQLGTLGEQQQVTAAEWENAKASLAESLLPVLTQGAGILGDMAHWLKENKDWAVPAAAAVGGVVAAIWLGVKATQAWTAAQIALDVAMDFNPIGLAIMAIVAGIALIALGLHKAGVTWADFANAGKSALNGVIWFINKIIDAYDWVFDKLNKIPHPGLPDLPHIPHIPSLAEGGVVPATPGGRIVRVAEAGEAEIVSPEGKLQRLVAAAVSSSMAQLSATQGDLYLALYIGDEPVRAIARAEVTDQARRSADWVRVARAGTGRLR